MNEANKKTRRRYDVELKQQILAPFGSSLGDEIPSYPRLWETLALHASISVE
ncbi:MAG: hypothetical protein U1D36_16170 [Hydrogenophaga sp.]|jgi:hypothetical protein|uniref:hypothetical protein n=1 Tax=Hydrogenophaga sp. TaxID=1904254 RepID=UPI002731A421|nr:hypothetical protein [Hydrogenophaga sp.]MDP2405057.1 hypothetical protein [Hydrogenophaga sp.]MDZ4175991.1 hypothetical protein [Hydrogenophaga sp.]